MKPSTFSLLFARLVALCCLMAGGALHAQVGPSIGKPMIAIEAPPPRMVVRDAQVPLRLESVAITTSGAGRLAQTSVELSETVTAEKKGGNLGSL